MNVFRSIPILLAAALAVVGADDGAVRAFQTRVQEYAALRRATMERLPALPKKATAGQIAKHEAALAKNLLAARSNAKSGEIFTPEVEAVFRQILQAQMSGRGGEARSAAVRQGNPKVDKEPGEAEPVVEVNAVYPKNAPLSTVPAGVLARLPSLPESIQYRFVGRTLVLWDSTSRLIIDYIKGAVPPL